MMHGKIATTKSAAIGEATRATNAPRITSRPPRTSGQSRVSLGF